MSAPHFPARRLAASVLAIAFSALSVEGQEWSRFRGPNGTGLSESKTIPVSWSEADYNWKVALPGGGHSSPVLWGNRIFLQAAKAGETSVVCLDEKDGRVVWQKRYPHGQYHLHKFSSFASGTCALDAERVYFTRQDGAQIFLVALRHNGEPAWEVPLGSFVSEWGSGHSPIVYGELVVVANDQDEKGAVLAVDRKTGKQVWSLPRAGGKADYSVPCVLEQPGWPTVLLFNSSEDGIHGIDPVAGKVVWSTAPKVLRMRSIASPVVAGGVVFASCGSGGGGNYVIAVQLPASGTAKAEVKYDIRKAAPYVPTLIAYGGLAFFWSDAGIVTCVDAATGTQKWQERVTGNTFSSPICVQGRIYGTAETGKVSVIAAADTYQLLATNDLGELTRATPAVANGKIYFRTFEHLISVGGAKAVAAR